MKYDRPVSELLEECAASLPEPFTRADILRWFRTHYPDVRSSTVGAHIFGLTDGDAPSRRNHQLGDRPPVLERVERGLYRRARGPAVHVSAATSEHPARTSAAVKPTVLLIGCVKSKRATAAPSRDLYTGTLFTRRREYADAAGVPWFVLSSRWGLAAPDEVLAPYDLYLGDTPASYRRAWGELVAAQLARRIDLRGSVVEIHAGDHYVDAVRPPLERAGATVVDAVDAGSLGATLAWYGDPRSTSPIAAPLTDPYEPVAESELVGHLSDPGHAISTEALRQLSRGSLARPGLYSWWVDDRGAEDLSHGLGHPIDPGLIYAGQAGATRWPSGKRSTNTLRGRLIGMHLGGRAGLSTFRKTLGSVLVEEWGEFDEQRLTEWMDGHLKVTPLPVDDADTLGVVEEGVLAELDPPLNLRGMPSTPLRLALARLRKSLDA